MPVAFNGPLIAELPPSESPPANVAVFATVKPAGKVGRRSMASLFWMVTLFRPLRSMVPVPAKVPKAATTSRPAAGSVPLTV